MKKLGIIRRARSARPRGMSLANLLRGAKGGACPPFLNRYKNGFILPLVIFAILAITFFMMFVNSMGSRYTDQVGHVDEFVRCRTIGESVFSTVLARVRNKPWSERFFANQPYQESDEPLYGGEYDLLVENTPGGENQGDVYIFAQYQRVKRLFFWRFRHENTILDAAGKVFPIIFTVFKADQSPSIGNTSGFNDKLKEILKERSNNKKTAQKTAGLIKPLSKLEDVLKVLNGPSGGNVVSSSDPAANSLIAAGGPLPPFPDPLPIPPEIPPNGPPISKATLSSLFSGLLSKLTPISRDLMNSSERFWENPANVAPITKTLKKSTDEVLVENGMSSTLEGYDAVLEALKKFRTPFRDGAGGSNFEPKNGEDKWPDWGRSSRDRTQAIKSISDIIENISWETFGPGQRRPDGVTRASRPNRYNGTSIDYDDDPSHRGGAGGGRGHMR